MALKRTFEKYYLLGADGETNSGSLLAETSRVSSSYSFCRFYAWIPWTTATMTLSLLVSLAVGILLGHNFSHRTGYASPYVRLEIDKDVQFHWSTQYSNISARQAELDRLWDTLPWEDGIIAMRNEDADAIGLPKSQPFPWDANEKSIYTVSAHHLLHCIRSIYIVIQQYRTDQNQTYEYSNVLHCLDLLRQETICSADDTLLYQPGAGHGSPGEGAPRKCRDWGKLKAFVDSHDPCYRYRPSPAHANYFQFCRPNSSYLPKIRWYFGYGDDWLPEAEDGPRELPW